MISAREEVDSEARGWPVDQRAITFLTRSAGSDGTTARALPDKEGELLESDHDAFLFGSFANFASPKHIRILFHLTLDDKPTAGSRMWKIINAFTFPQAIYHDCSDTGLLPVDAAHSSSKRS